MIRIVRFISAHLLWKVEIRKMIWKIFCLSFHKINVLHCVEFTFFSSLYKWLDAENLTSLYKWLDTENLSSLYKWLDTENLVMYRGIVKSSI